MEDAPILWRRLDRPGHEFSRLSARPPLWHLAGTAVFGHDHQPCRLEYVVVCDSAWNIQRILHSLSRLMGDGSGRLRRALSPRSLHILAALCGIVGTVTLVSSFVINPAPPANATLAQLREFASRNHGGIVFGGWLQGIGSLLTVLFALSLVHLAGATNRLAGWITLLAGGTILMVSLVEIAFYLAAAKAAVDGDEGSGAASNALIKAVQHVFLIAPALLLPLGAVLLRSRVLPRVFAYLALVLGATLQVLGLVGLFNVLQSIIDVLLMIQAVWFVAAATVILLRSGKASEDQPS